MKALKPALAALAMTSSLAATSRRYAILSLRLLVRVSPTARGRTHFGSGFRLP